MEDKSLVKGELAKLMSVLSHPHRIQILEDLRDGEKDVSWLQRALGVSQSLVSQHLATLRSNRIVAVRREGRHVYYRLAHAEIFAWLALGLAFVETDAVRLETTRVALGTTRADWGQRPRNGKATES